MGKINLLKNGYTGKVGQTVGQRWNGELTLRTHNEHNTSRSDAQLAQRAAFGGMIKEAVAAKDLLFNYNAPKGGKMSNWNFFTKSLSYILNAPITPGEAFSIRSDSKKSLCAGYGIFMDGNFWLILQAQSNRSPWDYSKTKFYGMGFPGQARSDLIKEFSIARPEFIKKNPPVPEAVKIRKNCVLFKTPLAATDRDILAVGLVLKSKAQVAYTEVSLNVAAGQYTQDQLEDWI